MPQMSPLWWEILFLLFIMTYILMNMFLYWMKEKSSSNKNFMNKSFKEMIWKF